MSERSEQAHSAAASRRKTARQGFPNRLSLFLRSSILDFLLVLVVSVSLVQAISFGFESAPDLRGNALVCAGIAAPLLVVLFAGSWSKRALLPAAVAAAVCGVAVIAALTVSSAAEQPVFYHGGVNDSADSNFVFSLVAVVTPVVVYLLSRRRAGVLALMVGSVLAFGSVQFLFRDWVAQENGVAVFAVGLIGVFALYVFQGYRSSIYAASRLKRTSFAAAAGLSVGIGAVCVLAGVGLFYALIAGLGVSTPQVKPFKDYYVRPVIEYSGNYTRQLVDDPDRTTSKFSEQKSDTHTNAPGGSSPQEAEQDETNAPDSDDSAGSRESFDATSWLQDFATVTYDRFTVGKLLLALLLPLALAVVVVLWRRRRKRRLAKIVGEGLEYRVCYLYAFLLERFKRMGLPKRDSLTHMEYAMANRAAMIPYAQGTDGVDFLDVTLAYQRAGYDSGNATEEDYEIAERFYNAFFKNARSQTSFLKWAFWYFWRI